ncbi:esterase-like activity of phytase family protein [Prauserella cavernicola]|uniref:Esterase-like activity of phytase family protein n=1 Tax=Prauserella cavernicola TaxID=2800127 RepID=A0A934QR54_9PSEU|nr:esterase-like activity of phytase family protein [Prauserella cavernicola]MBK1784593.1 esterase-like activity of phytase family protein [Prauserella cavernicola]
MSRTLIASGLLGALCLSLVAVPASADSRGVRVLGETTVPTGLSFEGTTVGGLSGIDRDPRTGDYVLISDDRSERQPARFYTARIDVTADGLGDVVFTGTHPFTGPDGETYPENSVDPEELRVDPWRGGYLWSQEGERGETGLADPSVGEATRTGAYVRDLPIPANHRMTETAGPRQNQALEAMTFAAHGALVVTAMEGPLLQDGPEATPEHGALSRITVQGRVGPVLAQYAYPQEPIFAAPSPGGSANNGVTSILASNPGDPTRHLVLERAYAAGVGNRVRIFEIDTSGATNVLRTGSLAEARHMRPVSKRLVADLADLPLSHVDNIEGMTWGPRLATGERSLLLVSDDNFSANQVTQVIALALR